jgi:hypothetical protein
MSEEFTLKNPAQLTQAIMALRALDKLRGGVAPLIIPPHRLYRCASCNQRKKLEAMHMIETTGVVNKVVDCLCLGCWYSNKKEASAMARVVCASCREVVAAVDPHKEKSGFIWKPGSCSHIARCPVCSDDPEMKASPIAEKIAFYKANGIPYE